MFTQARKRRKLELQDTSGMWHTMCVVDSDMQQHVHDDTTSDPDLGQPVSTASQSSDYDASSLSQRQRGIRLWNKTHQEAAAAASDAPPRLSAALSQMLPKQHAQQQRANATTVRRPDGQHASLGASACAAAGSALAGNTRAPACAQQQRRSYPCRYSNCNKFLSSSSNRARHERLQHKNEQMNLPLVLSELPAPFPGSKISETVRSEIDAMLQESDQPLIAHTVSESDTEAFQIDNTAADGSAPAVVTTAESDPDEQSEADGEASAWKEDDCAAHEASNDVPIATEAEEAALTKTDSDRSSSRPQFNATATTPHQGSAGSSGSEPMPAVMTAGDRAALQQMVRPLMQEADLESALHRFWHGLSNRLLHPSKRWSRLGASQTTASFNQSNSTYASCLACSTSVNCWTLLASPPTHCPKFPTARRCTML